MRRAATLTLLSLLLTLLSSTAVADVVARARQLLLQKTPAAAAALLLAKPCTAGVHDRRCEEQRYWVAEALWRCGQRAAALQRMVRVTAAGGTHFVPAARRVTRADLPLFGLQDPQHFLALPLDRLAQPVRRRLLERVGHSALRRGQLTAAERLLRAADSARGDYLRAVIAVQRGSLPTAARLFQASGKKAASEGNTALGELVALARGRLAASLADAERHYLRVGSDSPWFFRARQELAWRQLSNNRPADALLQTLALYASARRGLYYRPDAEVVEAAAFLALGHSSIARQRASAGQAALTAAVENLTSFLRQRREMRLYYISATESIARKTRELLPQIKKSLLADPSFRRAVQVLRQLQRERDRLFHGDARLRQLLSAELDRRLVRWQQRAGEMVRRLLLALRDELRLLLLRCREVLFESSKHPPADGSCTKQPPSRLDQSGVVRWPFVGELWPDELPSYRLSRQQPCSTRASATSR